MKSLFRILYLLILMLVIAALFLFFWENSQSVKLHFMHWTTPEHPLATSLLLSFCLGFLVASLYFFFEVIRSKAQVRRASKEKKVLQKEVDHLRNNPLEKESNDETLSSQSWNEALEEQANTNTEMTEVPTPPKT